MSAESFNDQSFEQQSSHKMFEMSREQKTETGFNVIFITGFKSREKKNNHYHY
jgi:hypothetical protein